MTDPTGWLADSDRTTIETAARTARSKGVSVDVVIVDNFSNMDAAQWCEQTLKNSVASNGTIIYYIGYETRKDGSCVKGGSISSSVRAEARAVAEAKLSSNPLTPPTPQQEPSPSLTTSLPTRFDDKLDGLTLLEFF